MAGVGSDLTPGQVVQFNWPVAEISPPDPLHLARGVDGVGWHHPSGQQVLHQAGQASGAAGARTHLATRSVSTRNMKRPRKLISTSSKDTPT